MDSSSILLSIVDFVIWLIFQRDNSGAFGPKHILCDGYRRSATEKAESETIPGVFSRYPNDQVTSLKSSPWPQLLALLGQSGEKTMINMLVDCSMFVAIKPGLNNFYQISGTPISELEHGLKRDDGSKIAQLPRKVSEITIVRSRMFYARPALTSRGRIRAGYRHIHVLNRCPHISGDGKAELTATQKNTVNTAKVMMYIFPRQFGLHNVFTSTIDPKKTAQKFQDYTVRDEEITTHLGSDQNFLKRGVPKMPKRLRGTAQNLIRRLQIRHRQCSYIQLIWHYCTSSMDTLRVKTRKEKALASISKKALSRGTSAKSGQDPALTMHREAATQHHSQQSRIFQVDPTTPIVDLATPMSHVSAFLQAALSKVLPDAFLGEGDDLLHNKALLAKKGFKISNIQWLQLPSLNGQKASQSETRKQLELFHELLYYIFDSLVIPLVRSTFYVTESNNHRYQLFYFRHDVWRVVSERAMTAIKDDMLEEIEIGDIQSIMSSQRLGFSQIRLLPKGASLRPIMNLRRRYPMKNNKKILGPSINTALAPIHNVLKLEKRLNPANLGASLLSVGDIYKRLREFRSQFSSPLPRLYFVKVDVQSAFDTIPQDAVLKLMAAILSHADYKIFKHAEVKPGDRPFDGNATLADEDSSSKPAQPLPKPVRRWRATAYPSGESSRFLQRLEGTDNGGGDATARRHRNTVFVNSAAQGRHAARDLLRLLAEHVADNRIRVGRKTYRQRRGIPQGSVLSSYLCSYFYADLEARNLAFLAPAVVAGGGRSNLLLRLIDDFLLITTDVADARRFAEVMHRGVPAYGVRVNPEKSLANFPLSVPVPAAEDGEEETARIRTVDSGADFPYCGLRISCRTLEIRKDCQRERQIDVSNTLTVDHGRSPGRNFERKVLNAFKIQSHLMFYDTSYNSHATVLETLRAAFRQTALKMWAYMRALGPTARPRPHLVKLTIMRTVQASHLILTSRFRKSRHQGYECSIRKGQVARLAYEAFEEVLCAKQTQHTEVLEWLRNEIAK
ncbi:Telomerase ribonucleoprotein complex - RNA-binding domain protein [Cordyceps fumosorosea ARSEF 2679]|uniref:Telomerase reverse transcriptase n=1 Tax=Cordyceps fumosorosea (strain ARSEF 2679) TaxID=1081104 RepID=A0A168E893_CORFA|nr:Telomerase ribonucleoprotein complex - RNA-binding domain protein [Cordyceps fumosorosea ARSEF 2679]OAA73491.1 Telomerase ribonucleoprotein complex - RNA-binding domain protein [Cordyceps fumosorosea ARSEF 2679]